MEIAIEVVFRDDPVEVWTKGPEGYRGFNSEGDLVRVRVTSPEIVMFDRKGRVVIDLIKLDKMLEICPQCEGGE